MDPFPFWAGWAFGVLCGILFVFVATMVAVAIEVAKRTEVRTFRVALSIDKSGLPLLQRFALWLFIIVWSVIEALGQIRNRGNALALRGRNMFKSRMGRKGSSK